LWPDCMKGNEAAFLNAIMRDHREEYETETPTGYCPVGVSFKGWRLKQL
jgi:hypothetical protein